MNFSDRYKLAKEAAKRWKIAHNAAITVLRDDPGYLFSIMCADYTEEHINEFVPALVYTFTDFQSHTIIKCIETAHHELKIWRGHYTFLMNEFGLAQFDFECEWAWFFLSMTKPDYTFECFKLETKQLINDLEGEVA